jgi:hypothetical protein
MHHAFVSTIRFTIYRSAQGSFAGTETTSNTLAVALYLLSIDPERLKKLHAEVDEAIPDADTCVDLSTARTLPYLNAVLKESMFTFAPRVALC